MFEYAWLMLLFPALGTLIIALFGTRLGKRVISWLAPGMVLLSFGVAVWMFVTMLGLPAEERSHEVVLWQWMVAGNFQVNIALLLDQLSITMALIVTGIGFLIHVYSAGYMHDDARFPRFFAYLNFFILMMLTLVLANNYLLLYVGWEGVGLASYLLIGFWFEKPSAADAGKKAFLVNRIGDFGLAIAIMFIWTTPGHPAIQRGLCESTPGLGRHCRRHHRDPAAAAGGDRQERADSALRLAAGRDGRPHPGLGPDPCRDHGDGRRVHAGPLGGAARPGADHEHLGGGHRRGRRRSLPRPSRSRRPTSSASWPIPPSRSSASCSWPWAWARTAPPSSTC